MEQIFYLLSIDDNFFKEELIIVIMRSATNTSEDLKREQECIMGELDHGVKVVKVREKVI